MNDFSPSETNAALHLKEIARKTGFSISSVSRALNSYPDKNSHISEKTRQKIVESARKTGFRRNRAAEFMRRGSQPTIGVFVPTVSSSLTADLILGISEVLTEEDFPVQIGSFQSKDDFHHFISRNTALSHAGIITYPLLISNDQVREEMKAYRHGGGKVVLLNSTLHMEGVPVVSMDESLGGRLAAERLLERSCERFAVLGEYETRNTSFLETLEARGKTAKAIPKDPFEEGPEGLAEVVEFCRGATESQPAGVFAVTDDLALRVIREFAATPLRIGREILLIGYDDLELTSLMTPALTTLHQPMREKGRLAARKLINILYNRPETSTILQPRLVIRDTA
ncbi:MAG: LacI family DNA-binding transcriptional regulator [Verrucomicrobiae bacterium]|nr:LacI family DNA-binding transcriptional regulator [Verrucomicrobiae bacterium]